MNNPDASEYHLGSITDRYKQRGYDHNFRAEEGELRSESTDRLYAPDELIVDETARFEGPSNPDDEAAVFALRARDGSARGTYTVAYGPSMALADAEIVDRLRSTGRPALDPLS